MVAGISLVNRRSRLGEDTGVGLLFVGMLALGVIIISKSRLVHHRRAEPPVRRRPRRDVGRPPAPGRGRRCVVLAGARVLATGRSSRCRSTRPRPRSLGLRPGATHLALLALIAVAIVSSFQAVGTLLVFGLLVGPPATAALLVRRRVAVHGGGRALGWLAVVVGLLVSYHYGTAAGATMAGVGVLLFFLVLLVQEAHRAARPPSARPAATRCDRRPATS